MSLKAVAKGLARVRSLSTLPTLAFPVETAKIIVFSDLHRGKRNGADDFQDCEPALNAALAYYERLGHFLVMLGDVEELWEEKPRPVLAAYRESYSLEAAFARAGRYLRIWGNHDDHWSDAKSVASDLGAALDPGVAVHEGALLRIVSDGAPVGSFFLAHGHQGTVGSDKASWFSRIVVRNLWRPLQRLTKISLNTPASDLQLLSEHNNAMYEWALANRAGRPKEVLVAGHTHKPVFLSQARLRDLKSQLAQAAGDGAAPATVAALAAEVSWIEAKASEEVRFGEASRKARQPVYFNTGCCCYGDGSITGLEIADGNVRLVRWPDDDFEPRPQTLASERLSVVFA